MKRLELAGKRFGRLLVEGISDRRRGTRPLWLCHCDCGTEYFTESTNLVSGRVRSCGCLKAELLLARARTHGESKTPVYFIWLVMRQRCVNPKDKAYPDYGGRGIKVCERWNDFLLFKQDMGPRPDGHEIDRRDNDGDYCPENCRWALRAVQARNKRSNHLITHNGRTACVAEWAEITGMSRSALSSRALRGWPAERIFNQPLKGRRTT